MRNTRHLRYSRPAGIALGLAVALLCRPVPAAAQPYPNTVEEFRHALRVGVDPDNMERDLKARQALLEKLAAAMTTITELRRALTLQDWRDAELDPRLSAVDEKVRRDLALRLQKMLRDGLRDPDPAVRLAAVTAMGDLGSSLRASGLSEQVRNILAADLDRVLSDPDPAMRDAAARALGRVQGNPQETTRALERLLRSPDVDARRAAARSLREMADQIAELARASVTSGVKASRGEVISVTSAVIVSIARGLRDPDAEVRRLSLEATLGSLNLLVSAPTTEIGPADVGRGAMTVNRGTFVPLARALAGAAPDVARALEDGDRNNRILAARILAAIGAGRLRLLRGGRTEPPATIGGTAPNPAPIVLVAQQRPQGTTPPQADGSPEALLLRALQEALPAVRRALSDPSARVRLAAVDTIESMAVGTPEGARSAADPAIPELVRALGDPDGFVRWAAARTLGRLDPSRTHDAVPGLIRLLGDPDVDVRQASARTLEHIGPPAESAAPALAQALGKGDVEVRVAIAHALEGIGRRAAKVAVPALAQALTDPDERMRRAAAETLGRLGPDAAPAAEALRRALDDPNPDVRQAASEALLNLRLK